MIEDAPVKELESLLAKVDILEPLPPEEVERLALRSTAVRLEASEAFTLEEDRETLHLLTRACRHLSQARAQTRWTPARKFLAVFS